MWYKDFVGFVKKLYSTNPVVLHSPVFTGREKEYLAECIDSTFVSYVGEFVKRFEKKVAEYTGARYAVATVNGTAALHLALKVVGVQPGDEVITQPLTFVATANAIAHCGAVPAFVDVERDTLGMSPQKLQEWLEEHATLHPSTKQLINRQTGRRIAAVVPVHVFGHPCRIDAILEVAERFHLPVVEDAAEALGSWYRGKHPGTFGVAGILSFNGNKIITTGGGGMVLTDDPSVAEQAYHLSTTAKKPHPWKYEHDAVGYNYRMPNVNAAIGVAQMEQLSAFVDNKRQTAAAYAEFFRQKDIPFITEPDGARSNYWLNAIVLENYAARDAFLEFTNAQGVMTRPVWTLLHHLPMYRSAPRGDLSTAEWLAERIVNIPSGVRS